MGEIRNLAAILVSDVVGYSRLAGADEDRILARLRALRSDLIEPTISVHHGRIVAWRRGLVALGLTRSELPDRTAVIWVRASASTASQGCDRFLRGADATVIGAVGGREVIGVCGFAGEE